MLLGNGWHRLPCGVAVLLNEDDQPAQICDVGIATIDIDDGVFAGDQSFLDMLGDDLRDLGWEVMLDMWVPTSGELRSALALELGDDRLDERASHTADVLGAEPAAPSTPPRRPVPGVPGLEVDRYGAFVVECLPDDEVRVLPLQESAGVLEVELDGVSWCVDELVRRAWDDDEESELELNEGRPWS